MIELQPEAIEVASRWLILAGPPSLPSTTIDAASSVAPSLRAAGGTLQPLKFGFGSGGFRLGNNLNLIQTLTRAQVLYPDALLSTPDAQRASVLPLQSGTDLSTLIADLKDAIRVPGWVGTLLKWSGLITMIVGIIAYFISPSLNNRRRGFMMATTGIVISIIGFAFPVVISLLDHVLSG